MMRAAFNSHVHPRPGVEMRMDTQKTKYIPYTHTQIGHSVKTHIPAHIRAALSTDAGRAKQKNVHSTGAMMVTSRGSYMRRESLASLFAI